MAPEILDEHHCMLKGYDPELSDVFSLGVIMFSIYMGKPPFRSADIRTDDLFRMLV